MNTPISYKLAKLLKEKGFDEQSFLIYLNGEIEELRSTISNSQCTTSGAYSAPIIVEVIMWFYKKHNIWISINNQLPRNEKRFEGYVSKIILPPYDPKNLSQFLHLTELYNSPTEACEAAIEFVLKQCI